MTTLTAYFKVIEIDEMYFLRTLILIIAVFTLSFAFKLNGKYIGVYDMKDVLNHSRQQSPKDPAIHSFPTEPVPPLIPICVKKGYFRDPFNCKKVYYCTHSEAVPTALYCEDDLVFNIYTNYCDYPQNVIC
ncbi:uncharacterized protein LOC117213618 [Bombus bifarius]|uniref:Uncharacterized protein LOC117213618 n=1 Tax=Bombus bifarius TaxID=103933 RepID=A0A6P8NKP5_9HYME|nr:uncharacterized protein LOC117213618 [Bombus bifarius]